MFTAAILAGGRATRLGGIDKGALTVDGRPILERLIATFRALTPHVVVVAGANQPAVSAGVRVLPDRLPGSGALGGLYTALAEAVTPQVFVVACDMPFLTARFVRGVLAAAEGHDAAIAVDQHGWHPLCAAYHSRLQEHLRSNLDAGQLTVTAALGGLDVWRIEGPQLHDLDPDGTVLINVNTPDDYARARARRTADSPSTDTAYS